MADSPPTQDELDELDVYLYCGATGNKQPTTAGEWVAEPVELGRRLTATETQRLGAADGYMLGNEISSELTAYILERPNGWILAVYSPQ